MYLAQKGAMDCWSRGADDGDQSVQKVLHAVLLLACGLFELGTRVFHLTILEIDLLVHGFQDLHGFFQELEEIFHHGGKRVGRNRHALVPEHGMALIAAFIARLRLDASLWGYAENVAERFGDAASLRSSVFGLVLLDQHLHTLVVKFQALLRVSPASHRYFTEESVVEEIILKNWSITFM